MTRRARIDEVRLACMMLTRLPVGRLGEEAPGLGRAAWAFPLVGLLTGLIGWAVHGAALWLGLSPVLAALAAVGGLVLATGALHLDGLADFADGIGGGGDRARRLEIMRDSRIGSYGVIALIVVIVAQVAAVSDLSGRGLLAAFLLAGVASRLAMLMLLLGLPPARADGLGHSAVAGGTLGWVPGACAVLVLAVFGGLIAVLPLVLAAVAAGAVAVMARRGIGGQTGDVLGAAQVASETAFWVALSAVAAT